MRSGQSIWVDGHGPTKIRIRARSKVMRTVLGLALFAVACGGADASEGDANDAVVVGADWVRVESSCGYGFDAPPDVTELAVQGIDSCVDAWTTGSCEYHGDYGGFSNDLSGYSDLPEFRLTEKSVGGRAARVMTARSGDAFVAAVYIPGLDADERIALTLWGECADKSGQTEALAAFGTVTINP
jgi:hypothetical protein